MKISLIEYKNHIDENGIPVGHGKKVLEQFSALLSAMGHSVCIVGHGSYTDTLKAYPVRRLKHASFCPGVTARAICPGS